MRAGVNPSADGRTAYTVHTQDPESHGWGGPATGCRTGVGVRADGAAEGGGERAGDAAPPPPPGPRGGPQGRERAGPPRDRLGPHSSSGVLGFPTAASGVLFFTAATMPHCTRSHARQAVSRRQALFVPYSFTTDSRFFSCHLLSFSALPQNFPIPPIVVVPPLFSPAFRSLAPPPPSLWAAHRSLQHPLCPPHSSPR